MSRWTPKGWIISGSQIAITGVGMRYSDDPLAEKRVYKKEDLIESLDPAGKNERSK